MVHVYGWPGVVLYKVSMYTFQKFDTCTNVLIQLYSCESWDVSYCTKFHCTRVNIDMCRAIQIFIVLVATLTRWVLYTFCTHVHSDRCLTLRNVFVHVSALTCILLYKILLYTCSCWHVSYWINVCCTRVLVDTFCSVQMFFVHVSKLKSIAQYKISFDTSPPGTAHWFLPCTSARCFRFSKYSNVICRCTCMQWTVRTVYVL